MCFWCRRWFWDCMEAVCLRLVVALCDSLGLSVAVWCCPSLPSRLGGPGSDKSNLLGLVAACSCLRLFGPVLGRLGRCFFWGLLVLCASLVLCGSGGRSWKLSGALWFVWGSLVMLWGCPGTVLICLVMSGTVLRCLVLFGTVLRLPATRWSSQGMLEPVMGCLSPSWNVLRSLWFSVAASCLCLLMSCTIWSCLWLS